MSERAIAAGKDGPPHTIDYNGKTYLISPALDDNVMLRVEATLYERAKKALADQRDMMDREDYREELRTLRLQYLGGHFAFESKATLEYLGTEAGAVLMLTSMMDASEGEVLELLMNRAEELQDVLKTVLEVSMPAARAAAPGKRRAPRKRV